MCKGEDLASMILVFEVENLDLEGSFLDRVVCVYVARVQEVF